jgi:hypothetical protein
MSFSLCFLHLIHPDSHPASSKTTGHALTLSLSHSHSQQLTQSLIHSRIGSLSLSLSLSLTLSFLLSESLSSASHAAPPWVSHSRCRGVCVYYCRTYDKAVRGGEKRRVEDMCYERRQAEACVDESAHHALANAGGREIV